MESAQPLGAGHRQLRGYRAGALLGIVMPAVTRSVLTLRAALVLVVVTLALMGATENHAAWLALRPVAAIASALVFMIAVSVCHSQHSQCRRRTPLLRPAAHHPG